jgi:hypothetical protein
MLKVFIESRREYEARFITQTIPPPDATDSMRLGSLAHAMLLEPRELENFAVIPDDVLAVDKNGVKSRKGKLWEAFVEHNAGKTLLKAEEFAAAMRMIEAVKSKCGDWFNVNGLAEHEIRWTDEMSGLPCKAKIDYLLPRGQRPLILDFKTAKSSTPRSFRKAVKDYQYHLQEAHYTAGVQALYGGIPRFLFVVVKSEPPHQCRVYETPEAENAPTWAAIAKDDAKFHRDVHLGELARCYKSGDWSDPGEDKIYQLHYEDCQ